MSKSSITTKPEALSRPPGGWPVTRVKTHPGAVLREDFLKELGISGNELALRIGVPATRINEILHERRAITPDTAIRLGLFFEMPADIWLRLQTAHDLSKVALEKGEAMKRIVQPLKREEAA